MLVLPILHVSFVQYFYTLVKVWDCSVIFFTIIILYYKFFVKFCKSTYIYGEWRKSTLLAGCLSKYNHHYYCHRRHLHQSTLFGQMTTNKNYFVIGLSGITNGGILYSLFTLKHIYTIWYICIIFSLLDTIYNTMKNVW